MNILFYTFAKRNNSTKIVNTTAETRTCQLKDQTDMVNPTLIIKDVPSFWSPIWNYCDIPAFSRYYFINNWKWLNGVWECQCTVDVLATYKTQIGNLEEYVVRSSNMGDGRIVDTAYPTKAIPTHREQLISSPYVNALAGGFYLIGIIGNENTAAQGAITYYQMTPAEFARLRAYMLSDNFLTAQGLVNLADFIPADATKVIYNPYQYIVSCQWFPFPASAIPAAFKTSVNQIHFGWWNTGTGFSAYRINENCPVYQTSQYLAFEIHPQASRGEYLNHAPYSKRILRFEPFGEVLLDDDIMEPGMYFEIRLNVDLITGIGILEVFAATQISGVYTKTALLVRESQQISVDIQLAQVGKDYYGAMATHYNSKVHEWNMGVSSVSGIFNSNSMGSLASNSFSAGAGMAQAQEYDKYVATGDYLKASAPQLLTGGTNGSLAAYAVNNYINSYFYMVADDDVPQLGKPLFQKKVLNTIPGFIMTQNADISISCFQVEKDMIGQYLTSGFFYE